MPTKQQPDITYGEKLISLFARLLFSGEWLSLTQLARELDCSKQTVLRLIRDIESGYSVPLETNLQGQRRVYRIPRRTPHRPAAMLTHEELESLLMCRAFTEHLLGRDHFDLATRALEKTTQLVTDHELAAVSSSDFGVFRPGSIDYRPFHPFLRTLTEAMQEHLVCKARYRKPGTQKAETIHIKPLKIFAWRETIYVHARHAKVPGATFKERNYDPLLALQRFESVAKTTTSFRKPKDYDFDKAMNRHFGLIRGKPFKVTAEFSGWAADYVAERQWSPKQKMQRLDDGRLRLEFDAVSMPEVVTWVIGFGCACEARSPKALIEAIRARVAEVEVLYPGMEGRVYQQSVTCNRRGAR
jgi:predicted DNA-binding transcriptional regulator YafY